MNHDSEPQYNRRTFIKHYRKLVQKKRAKYNVVTVAPSPSNKKLIPHWRDALKYALRVLKKRYGIEYILLFEKSKHEHKHAHIVLTKKVGKHDFIKASNDDIDDFRTLFFRQLYHLVTESSPKEMGWKEVAKELKIHYPKQMVKSIKFYLTPEKQKIPAGRGPGFLSYLLEKREAIETGTIISYGLLQLRNKHGNK